MKLIKAALLSFLWIIFCYCSCFIVADSAQKQLNFDSINIFTLRNSFRQTNSTAKNSELRFFLSTDTANLDQHEKISLEPAPTLSNQLLQSYNVTTEVNIGNGTQNTIRVVREYSTFRISESTSFKNLSETLEYTLLWSDITKSTSAYNRIICFELGNDDSGQPIYWQSTYLDRTQNPTQFTPSLNYRRAFRVAWDEVLLSTPSSSRPVPDTPLFMSQSGFALLLDDSQAWSIQLSNYDSKKNLVPGILCASPKLKEIIPEIRIRVIIAPDIRQAYQTAIRAYFPDKNPQRKPLPDHTLLEYPFWSTDSINYRSMSREAGISNGLPISSTGDFLNLLRVHGFNRFHLIFESLKLPEKLKKEEKPLSSPYVSELSLLLIRLNQGQAFKQDKDSSRRVFIQIEPPSNTNQTTANLIEEMIFKNLTEAQIVEQYAGILEAFLQSSLGGLALLESDQNTLESSNATKWIEKFYRILSYAIHHYPQTAQSFLALEQPIVLSDIVHKAQAFSVLVQLTNNRNEQFDSLEQLRRILVETQLTSLVGYPFIQARHIRSDSIGKLPNFEFYARWVQMSTFMPLMFIPAPPWYYPEEDNAVQLTHKFLDLHQRVALSRIQNLLKLWIEKDEPLIRPLWYAEPEDSLCFISASNQEMEMCDTEFMLGPDLVVAPVVQLGARARDVYLPRGCWNACWISSGTNGTQQQQYQGHQVHFQIPAPLDTLLWFTRVDPKDPEKPCPFSTPTYTYSK